MKLKERTFIALVVDTKWFEALQNSGFLNADPASPFPDRLLLGGIASSDDSRGIWIRPLPVFGKFEAPLLVPWSFIRSVCLAPAKEEKRLLGFIQAKTEKP
jgi:hypothetical protein